MKKMIMFILLALVFSVNVKADNNYTTQYQNVGADKLYDTLDKDTKRFFDESNIDLENPNWVNQITSGNVLLHICKLVTGGLKLPLKAGILIASIIFLSASITAFGLSPNFETAIYAAVLAISALISTNVWQSVEAAVNAVKGCSSFMLTFVPIFASILALSGKTVTATAMNGLLLGASEVVSVTVSFTVLPLMGGYLALSIGVGVSPLLNNSSIVESVKKLSMWILSLISTVFIGVLSIQSAVNSAADSVALRTTKFILGLNPNSIQYCLLNSFQLLSLQSK